MCHHEACILLMAQEVFEQARAQFPDYVPVDKAAKPIKDVPVDLTCDDPAPRSSTNLMHEAFMEMLGKPQREVVAVDVGAKIAEMGLAKLIPPEASM